MIKPEIYAKACLNAISLWGIKVLPIMFPFLIISRLILNLSNTESESKMNKFWNKLYHTPKGSFNTFCLAAFSGYPVGAKVIAAMCENKQVNVINAKKMLSYCSVSGPMFILGTVGTIMLKNYKAGLIILISNIIASLLNGLIYRGKNELYLSNETKLKTPNNILQDSVYDSLISILMIASYMVLSFLIIELLNHLKILNILTCIICKLLNLNTYHNAVQGFLSGIIEITRGILDISNTTLNLKSKTILASTLVGFGGISIILQSLNFLSKLKIPCKYIIKQKITQAILCFIITFCLCFIFL